MIRSAMSKTGGVTTPSFGDVCVCSSCFGELEASGGSEFTCAACGAVYAVRDDVLMLLPPDADGEQRRYLAAYDIIARDDLREPFEYDRRNRHDMLLDFIGDVRGKTVLDIGSSNAGYLQLLDARGKVALDIAQPFLAAIPPGAGVVRVCADAENLPVRAGAFDVIVLSDVLEHVLSAENVVSRLTQVVRPDSRIIVHIPWREDISKYAESPYEFTHLRSFDYYSFALLWHAFSIRRESATHPALEEPLPFQLRRLLPLRLYDTLLDRYFRGGLAEREYTARARWIAELPRRERRLLLVYPAKFRMFELRLRAPRRHLLQFRGTAATVRRSLWRR